MGMLLEAGFQLDPLAPPRNERQSATTVGAVRHRRLMAPHYQPLRPALALLAPEPAPDILEQHVPPARVRQRSGQARHSLKLICPQCG